MLKSKLFKSLVVAGLITAISVPVFAAGQTEQVQPTMRDKVEKILSEGDADARRPMPLRRGTPLTPEQRAERDAARLAWMEMTPQQKFEQRQKWHDEFLSKLPAEKREAIEKREAEARAKWASMSEEQKQDALKDMFRGPRGAKNKNRTHLKICSAARAATSADCTAAGARVMADTMAKNAMTATATMTATTTTATATGAMNARSTTKINNPVNNQTAQ